MNSIDTFRKTLNQDQPPDGLTQLLLALWWEAKGDWKKAHTITQEINNLNAAWVHAYLHRKEGDDSNADYWYSRARKPKPTLSHDQEWEQIACSLL